MAERHGRMLSELGEMSLSLARRLHERAMAEEDAAAQVRLAAAFHRMGRAMRQCVALEARLAREALRARREARELAAEEIAERRQVRRREVAAALAPT